MKKSSRFKTLREFVNAQPRQKTQNVIAEELGIAANTLSQYLSGARIPNRETALRLSEELGIPLQNLLAPPDVPVGDRS